MSVTVLTFGCRLNTYESVAMRDLAAKAGLQGVIVINTCAVTAEAERQARQALRRAHRAQPQAPIIVTGCSAEIAPQRWAGLPGVVHLIPNAEKLNPERWAALAAGAAAPAQAATGAETRPPLLSDFAGRARAFVEVQQGCDHRCTFCVIPLGRGPSRSVPPERIIEQVQTLVAAGYREVVLTGVDITAYGHDLPGQPRLGALVRRLLRLVPDLPRLRLSSLDPIEIDADLWRALAEEERLMPHLHLSLQHGADLILKRMKRRHRRADAIAIAERARRLRPNIVLGADLIAGFPTETEQHFAQTLSLIEACGLTFLHVFPYSPRPGTAAERMPQLPPALRRERAARLRAAGAEAAYQLYRSRIGATEAVLFERNDRGHTEHFAPLRLIGGQAQAGDIRRLKVSAAGPEGLIAEAPQ